MPADLSPLLAALDEADAGVVIDAFIRDDDAGWDDARQLALLDATARAGVPIDLAAIPQALGERLARELAARIDDHPGLLGVHQHGFAHANHEAQGRKCEFGPTRDADAQRADLRRGQQGLAQALGPRVDPIFTPPWNRCAPHTPLLLAELGFTALSRDRGATPHQQALPELPVALDWCKHVRTGGTAAALAAWAQDLRACRAERQPFGLMLHHAAMQADEFDLLADALARLARHASLRWHPMRALLPTGTAATAGPARHAAA